MLPEAGEQLFVSWFAVKIGSFALKLYVTTIPCGEVAFSVIIDGSQVPMVYAADALDITRAFITEFNTKNPATASIAAPK